MYKNVISDEIIFSSKDKFNSGSGYPSFAKPVKDAPIQTKPDYEWGSFKRDFVLSDGNYLGHKFYDGPKWMHDGANRDGGRYCINSACLKFVPADELSEI